MGVDFSFLPHQANRLFIGQSVIDMVVMGMSIISAIIVVCGHRLHMIALRLLPTIWGQ